MLFTAGQSFIHNLPTLSNTLAHAQWKNMHNDAGKKMPLKKHTTQFPSFP